MRFIHQPQSGFTRMLRELFILAAIAGTISGIVWILGGMPQIFGP